MHRCGSRERLIDDLHAVVEDAEALLKVTSVEGGETIADLRSRVEKSLRQARKHIERAQADSKERARQVTETAESRVREKPWQSVGIAAGLGLLLGLLISRR